MEILGYLAILIVGLLLGSIGSGGSILSVPILVCLFSMDIESASAYSLFLVGTTSLTGALLKHGERLLSVRAGAMFGMPSLVSTFASRRWILDSLPDQLWRSGRTLIMKEDLLIALLSLLMVGSGITMLSRSMLNMRPRPSVGLSHLIPCGLFVGAISGLAGIGGGFLILPALIFFAGLPFTSAVGTTLMIIAFNCLLGFCGDALRHSINWPFLLSITALAVTGVLAGWWSGAKILAATTLHKAFAILTIFVGIFLLTRQL